MREEGGRTGSGRGDNVVVVPRPEACDRIGIDCDCAVLHAAHQQHCDVVGGRTPFVDDLLDHVP